MSTETKFQYWDENTELCRSLENVLKYAAASGKRVFLEMVPPTKADLPDMTRDVYEFLMEQHAKSADPWKEKAVTQAVYEFIDEATETGWEELHHGEGGPEMFGYESAQKCTEFAAFAEALERTRTLLGSLQAPWEKVANYSAIARLREALAKFIAANVNLSEAAYKFTGRTLTVFADGTWQLKEDEQ